MPAMHLISVDFPAPLSPTSAITSPARTSKSTSVRAWTEPKLFVIPFITRSGAGARAVSGGVAADGRSGATVIGEVSQKAQCARRRGRRLAQRACRLAVLRVLARAHVRLLEEAVREQQLPVVLRDRLRRQEHRRHV